MRTAAVCVSYSLLYTCVKLCECENQEALFLKPHRDCNDIFILFFVLLIIPQN